VIGREPLPMIADYDRAVRDHEIDLLHADGELIALIELIRNSDHLFAFRPIPPLQAISGSIGW
jgi:hypothetical protein